GSRSMRSSDSIWEVCSGAPARQPLASQAARANSPAAGRPRGRRPRLPEWDSNPLLTFGCGVNMFGDCIVLTPWSTTSVPGFIVSDVAVNTAAADQAGPNFELALNYNTSTDPRFVYAAWTLAPVAAVPEPATLSLMLGPALGLFAWHR